MLKITAANALRVADWLQEEQHRVLSGGDSRMGPGTAAMQANNMEAACVILRLWASQQDTSAGTGPLAAYRVRIGECEASAPSGQSAMDLLWQIQMGPQKKDEPT